MSFVSRLHDWTLVYVVGVLCGLAGGLLWNTTRTSRNSAVDQITPPTVNTNKLIEVRFLRTTSAGAIVEDRTRNYWLYRGVPLADRVRFTPVSQQQLEVAPVKTLLEVIEQEPSRPLYRLLRQPESASDLFFLG